MQFLFSTGSLWTYGTERCFDVAARAGFDGIELMVDQRWDTRQPDYLNGLAERFGQPVFAVHSPFSPATPGWPGYFDDPGRIRASVTLAEAVGARVVVHHLPERFGSLFIRHGEWQARVPWPGRKAKLRYRDWLLGDYIVLQAQTDVRLCIENMPAWRRLGRRWNVHFWNTPGEIVRFTSLTLDTTHLGTWGIDAADIYPSVSGYVRHVHLSNFDGCQHRRPEMGHLHLDRLLAQMAADDYTGAITLELNPDALDAGKDDAHVVELLTNSLRLCRAWAGTGAM
jgi:sugar phosphate isomerase/epimerase